jgi:acyl-CoA synthetase (AMP-forming)/AMP-acid ligase II
VNLAVLLEMAADGHGDRVAVGSREGGLTFADVYRMAGRSATRLRETDAASLAVLATNGPVVPVALFAAAWAGMSYAPLNYRLPQERLERLIDRLQPAVLVQGDAWLDESGRGGNGETSAISEDGERPAVLLFTSGTSAEPKAAVLEHDNLASYVFNTVEFGSAEPDEAALLAVPPFHVAGVTSVISSCYCGRRLVPLPSFSAEGWLDAARREEVTHALVVPTMLGRIVDALESTADAAPPRLRSLAYGGSRMPLPVLERALRLFPDTGFVNAYGLTETSSTIAVLGPEDHRLSEASDDPAVRRRLGSAGRPVPGVEVIVADEQGQEVATAAVGEICVRGPQVSGRYLDTDARRGDGGWLRTGDMGFMDTEGYLFVTGRGDDLIISGGENISPSEVEDVMLGHPAVAAAAAAGIDDPEWGERVGAMVSLRPGAEVDPDALRAWAAERLGSLKAPRVLMVATELPSTATGKVLRREVRAALAAEQQRR